MEKMTFTQKVGQRLVVGFSGTKITGEFIKLVQEYKIGNVVLFKENVTDNIQLKQLCRDIQAIVLHETGRPAFITMDQEGGSVSRLEADAAAVPGAMAIAATGKKENAYEAGYLTGRELAALGVNFNLAPDMDINTNPSNPVIGARSYGDKPEVVSEYGVEMINGLVDAHVLCAAKHFPGHGDTIADSHLGLPVVDKPFTEITQCELKPFEAAIQAGVPAIMVAHILYPALEKEKIPASMSRSIVTGLLKEQMGFSGLVLSDCLMMNAIAENIGVVKGAVAAVKAGIDLVFISHSLELAAKAAQALVKACEDGQINYAEMTASVNKILHYKRRRLPLPIINLQEVGCEEHRKVVARMMEEAITEVNIPPEGRPELGSSPLFLGCPALRASNAANPEDYSFNFPMYMAKTLGGTFRITSADPTKAEIDAAVRAAQDRSCLIIGTVNGHLRQGQMYLVRALYKTGIPTICVALRNPYDLIYPSKGVYTLAAYDYNPLSLQAVAEVLAGRKTAPGILPVKM